MSIKEEQGAFGPFRVLHQIGVGALGPVFRTYEPARDRLVAVKVFKLDITPEQAQTLAQELSKAAEAGLFHPSIVEPVAAGVQGTVAYRAEEYVAAETLDVALRHYAPAPTDKALPFITQLAGAIDFARAAGVGHGSLHPRDIFVTPEEARATGFGVVDALERVGLRAPVRRPYSAPERIDGREWGTPADVFSLAAISYELLTGRRPSGTGDGIGNLSGAVVGPQSDALLAVLARAMHADPAARYPTALAFASALEAASREERPRAAAAPVVAAPPPAAVAPPIAMPPIAAAEKPPAADVSIRQPPSEPDDRAADIEDDITDERDEDELHHSLILDERAREDAAETMALRRDDEGEEPEAEADREMIEAAALASLASDAAGERYRDEFQTPRADEGRRADRAGEVPHRPAFGSVRPAAPPPRYAPALVPAGRSRFLPLAAMLAIGLLVGFAVGYGVGSREPASEPERSATAAPAAPSGSAPGAAPGRDFSDQAVAPPQVSPPQVARQSQQPSATPPPIPSEAPAESRPADRGIATSGRLVVRSEPTRAGVLINGRWRGRTPLMVERVPFGRYSVRVVQPGYAPGEESFALSPDDPARTLSLRLRPQSQAAREAQPPPAAARASQPAGRPQPGARSTTAARDTATRPQSGSFTGAIYVDSRPQGARVFLDGKAVGTTPLTLPAVPIGSHVVRLELLDHRPWTASRQVTSGRTERITGSLDRIR